MELEKALKEMRNGKKIRRCDFEENNYIVYTHGNIVYHTQSGLLDRYSFNTLDFESEWEIVSEKLYIFDVIRIIKQNMNKIDSVTLDESEVTICLNNHEQPLDELRHFGICRMMLNTDPVWIHTIPLIWEHEWTL